MRRIVVSLMLGVGLVAFGASDAKAAPADPFCFDFTGFCDCLTVFIATDPVGGPIVAQARLYATIWQNQDCAGTTSALQGLTALGRNSNAGELDDSLGLGGINWNFTWVTGGGVFDLDYWDGNTQIKVQDNVGYCLDVAPCPADCLTSCGGLSAHLPSSTGR